MKFIAIIILLVIMGVTGLPKLTPDEINMNRYISPMEALDLVKETYAGNFTKICLHKNPGTYFYKSVKVDFYLVYEDTDEETGCYLFHLYEFVTDDIDSGIGHTVTYGWYWLDPNTGRIWEYPGYP